MSITRQVTVWCDECGRWEQASMTAAELRRQLHKMGWYVGGRPGAKDVCPDCARRAAERIVRDDDKRRKRTHERRGE